MAKIERWLSPVQIYKRWDIDKIALAKILDQGLAAYYLNNGEKLNVEYERDENGGEINLVFYLEEVAFKFSDILLFESENEWLINSGDETDMKLFGKDARLLGQLKREKDNWDKSLAVAVQIGIFCAQEDREAKRDEIHDLAYKLDSNISKATVEKIWKAIPVKFRKSAGAPKKK